MTDEVIERLLKKKGILESDGNYEEERIKLQERLEDTMAQAMVEAMVEPDRVEKLRTLINGGADSDEIEKFFEESEIDTKAVFEAFSKFENEYLEEK